MHTGRYLQQEHACTYSKDVSLHAAHSGMVAFSAALQTLLQIMQPTRCQLASVRQQTRRRQTDRVAQRIQTHASLIPCTVVWSLLNYVAVEQTLALDCPGHPPYQK